MLLPTVSVIVPGHNASGTLGSSLSSLRGQEWPKDRLEIVYVDDASTDQSIDVSLPWVDRIVRLTGLPHGPAAARNSGVRQSSGEILVFLDADVVAPPGTIRALVEPLMQDKNLDAVFGSYDSEPSDRTVVSQYRNLLHHFVHQTSRQNAATFWAGCGAIRRRSFERAGEFDAERYRGAMIEDIELGHRMRALGMQIQLRPSIQVKHLKRWTLLQMLRADIFSRGVPWMRLLLQGSRASGEVGDLNLRLSGAASVALSWTALFLLGFAPWLPGLLSWACMALGLGFLINLPTYQFFVSVRGLCFTLMILPLHFLYHLYNGVSVLGALTYNIFFDRPLPGLKSIGAAIQERYWRHLHLRRHWVPEREKPGTESDRTRIASAKDVRIRGRRFVRTAPATKPEEW